MILQIHRLNIFMLWKFFQKDPAALVRKGAHGQIQCFNLIDIFGFYNYFCNLILDLTVHDPQHFQL